LDHFVDQWSLAVCDGNTFPSSALIETDQVRKDAISSLYYATYSEDMKWYFLHQQTPEEALIFKHFDSKSDVRASCEYPNAFSESEAEVLWQLPRTQASNSIRFRSILDPEGVLK
jgi:hypothetical protein